PRPVASPRSSGTLPAAWYESRRAAWPPNPEANPQSPHSLLQQRLDVALEFIGVESRSQVLHPERSALIDHGCQKRVIHAAVALRLAEHGITARDIFDLFEGAREKRKVRQVCRMRLRIFPEDGRRVVQRIDGYGSEEYLRRLFAEIALNPDQFRSQQRTGFRTRGENERDHRNPAPNITQREAPAVLIDERESWSRPNARQSCLLAGRRSWSAGKAHGRKARKQSAAGSSQTMANAFPCHAFISFFS